MGALKKGHNTLFMMILFYLKKGPTKNKRTGGKKRERREVTQHGRLVLGLVVSDKRTVICERAWSSTRRRTHSLYMVLPYLYTNKATFRNKYIYKRLNRKDMIRLIGNQPFFSSYRTHFETRETKILIKHRPTVWVD